MENKKEDHDIQEEEKTLRQQQYEELIKSMEQIKDAVTLNISNLKKFVKTLDKDICNSKKMKKNKKNNPSGFGKVNIIPVEFLKLLNLNPNTQMTRPNITKEIYSYIKTNDLIDKTNKRIIRCNTDLANALKLTDIHMKQINDSMETTDEGSMNFYNIQKFIAHVYKK
jgi:chromatin remodeling complex protein RSC6